MLLINPDQTCPFDPYSIQHTELLRSLFAQSSDYVVTKICDPKDNDGQVCEWVDADGTVTVERGNRKQTVKVKGGYGC